MKIYEKSANGKEKGWKWNEETHHKEKKLITISTYVLFFLLLSIVNIDIFNEKRNFSISYR